MDRISRAPRLVASTSDTYCCSIANSKVRESKLQEVRFGDEEVYLPADNRDEEFESNYFKSAQWYDPTHFIIKRSNHSPGRQMEPLSLPQTKTIQSELSFSHQRSSNRPLQKPSHPIQSTRTPPPSIASPAIHSSPSPTQPPPSTSPLE
jgi:hypothetical protein